ncbi:MAG: glycoside hydrolase family 88 protein, partial [Bacteroidales bacterium]|nr:glycoside hydrolase family 88 protein [Bacteroidales bacterium]
FDGLLNRLIKENPDGTISITQCCSVGGLGGSSRRDGSFEYYISEPVRDNDAKATGPFILAAMELSR